MVWPAIIAGASSLIGGAINAFNAGEARDAQSANINAQMAQQREFATTGLQWRAGDAMKAYEATGIHPLALLGVNTPTYTPVNASFEPDRSMGNAISEAGQGISRAMLASASEETRAAALKPLQDLALTRGALENDLLRVRIASETARLRQMMGPGVPGAAVPDIPGQPNGAMTLPYTTGLVRDTDPGNMSSNVRPGVPDVTYARTPQGEHAVPSKDVKELIEDNFFHEAAHFIRNNLFPMIGMNMQPPRAARPGFAWRYHPLYGYQEYPTSLDVPRGAVPDRAKRWGYR